MHQTLLFLHSIKQNKKTVTNNLSLFILLFISSVTLYAQPVKNVGAINGAMDEQNPVLFPGGQYLYFTRANDSANVGGYSDKGDIWISEIENGNLLPPKNAGKALNDPNYNSVIGFSPDGNSVILSSLYTSDGKPSKAQGLSIAYKKSGVWTKPKKLDINYFYNKSDHISGSISNDGRVMVLSIDSYASRGKEDIYVSFYESGKWTEPKNLGSAVNTSYQEVTPYLAPDNKTLFFSSNAYDRSSGRNVYMSERQDSTWRNWSAPKPVGQNVNTIGVDLYFKLLDTEWAMLTSTENSDGYGDLKIVPFSTEDITEDTVQQIVEHYEEAAPTEEVKEEEVDAGFILLRLKVIDDTNQETIVENVNISSDQEGNQFNLLDDLNLYEALIPDGTQEVNLTVKAPGYLSVNRSVELNEDDQEKVTIIHLKPLKVGTKVQLSNVYFEQSKAVLKEQSFEELDKVVEMLNENPNIEIRLEGHTDNQGNSRLNLKLSQERVDTVMDYLIDKGISSKRIKGKGYGGSRPIASNASEETRKLNRRVEFVVIKD